MSQHQTSLEKIQNNQNQLTPSPPAAPSSHTQEEESLEYDDVYVVEERTVPAGEVNDVGEGEEGEAELSFSLSSEDEDEDMFSKDYDRLKLASERSRAKMEKRERREKIEKMLNSSNFDFRPKTLRRAEVVEDFIRNFFVRMRLVKTLDEFNREFSELSKKGKFNDNYLGPITDIYIKNAKLEEKLQRMQRELEKASHSAEEVKSNWDNLRKERDFHRENYVKTRREKENITKDIKTLQSLHSDFRLKIDDLNLKYEHLCKNKSLLKLDLEKMKKERDRKESEILRIQEEINNIDIKSKKSKLGNRDEKIVALPYKRTRPGEKVPWPHEIRNNIFLLQNPGSFSGAPNCVKNIKAYDSSSASSLTVHIKKNVVATGGDDAVFKI